MNIPSREKKKTFQNFCFLSFFLRIFFYFLSFKIDRNIKSNEIVLIQTESRREKVQKLTKSSQN